MRPFLQSRLLPVFPAMLLLLNLVTKGWFLTDQDIGLDEPFSIYHAQFDLSTLIEQLSHYNNPPLYEVLLHGWIKLFGISPLAVRLLPFLFAIVAPVALYYFGKRYFSLPVAITSSLLLSLSSLLLYYSHDCRVYSLFILLSLLSMHFFLDLAESPQPRLGKVVLFVIISALLIYAHYFGFFILFFQGIYLLFFLRKELIRFVAYYFWILIVYLPQIYTLFIRMGHSVKNGTWLQPPSGMESLYNMLWSFSNYPFVTVACIGLLLAGLTMSIKNKTVLRNNKKWILLLIWFLVPFLGMFFISYWVPMYISRYLIFVLPAYYLLIAACIEKLVNQPSWRHLISAALVTGFACTLEVHPDKKQPVAKLVQLIKDQKDPETCAIGFSKDFLPTLAYYYNRRYFSTISDGKEYHLTDSLLQSDHIWLVNTQDDRNALLIHPCRKVICFMVGATQGPNSEKMLKGYTRVDNRQLNDNFQFSVFVRSEN